MGLTYSLDFRIERSNIKQKERFDITDTTKKDFRNFLNNFNNSFYLGYKSKKVHNELTEAYLFLIKHITKLIKIKRHVILSTIFLKLGFNETIGHVNKAIQSDE